MALDNVLALFLLPVLRARCPTSTHTKLGRSMPYILAGTACGGGVYDAAAGLGQG